MSDKKDEIKERITDLENFCKKNKNHPSCATYQGLIEDLKKQLAEK